MNYVEKMIARKIVEALQADNQKITVDFERGYDPQPPGDILEQMDEVDECWLMLGEDDGSGFDGGYVYFIWGNGNGGWHCLSDYTMGIEPIIRPVLDFIEKNGD